MVLISAILIQLYEAWNKPEKPTSGEYICHKQKLI
jgi:hypothetical protein